MTPETETIQRLRQQNADLLLALKAAVAFINTVYPIEIDSKIKAEAFARYYESDPTQAIANAEKLS